MEDRLGVILNRIEQRLEELLEKQKRTTETTKGFLSEGSVAERSPKYTGPRLHKRQAAQ